MTTTTTDAPAPIVSINLPAITTTAGELAEYRATGQRILEWARALTIDSEAKLTEAVEQLGAVVGASRAAEDGRRDRINPANQWVKAVNDTVRWVIVPLFEAEGVINDKVKVWKVAERERQDRERREAEERARLARLEADRKAVEARAAAEAAAKAERDRLEAAQTVQAALREAVQAAEEATTLPEFMEAQERIQEVKAGMEGTPPATEDPEVRRRAAEASRQAEAAVAVAINASAAAVQAAQPLPRTVITAGGAKVTLRQRWTFMVVDEAAVPRRFLSVDEGKIRAAVAEGAREIPGVHVYQTDELATTPRRR